MRLIIVICLLIAVGVAVLYWGSGPQPVAVRVHALEPGRVASTVANTRAGTVKACRRSYLAPAVAGQIANLPAREGDRVVAGDLLVGIWNQDLAAKLALAEAQAQASMAREEEACLRAQEAVREARRLRRLRQRSLVSEEVVDRAETEQEALAAGCRAARAATRVSASQVDLARAMLAQTELRAPFAGIVAEVNGELGEYITPSPPGIATLPAVDLIDDACLLISAPIDEVDAPGIRAGQPVCVSLDAFTERLCSGRVRRIAPYVLDREKQARTVEVEVELSRPEEIEGLLVGFSADVEIELESREQVLRVPTEAVLEGYRVLVLEPEAGTREAREFGHGLANWEYTEVLGGLEAGELVVTSVAREGVTAGAAAVAE